MNSLMKEITNAINKSVMSFTQRICDEHNLDFDEVYKMWTENENSKIEKKIIEKKTIEKPKISKKIEIDSEDELEENEENEENDGKCTYVFLKGAKQGEKCGTKVKDDSAFCSTHKKYENAVPKVAKKQVPEAKKSIISKSNQKEVVKKPVGIKFSLNPQIKKYCDEDGLVIKSQKDNTVVSRFNGTSIERLTKTDIELCKKKALKFSEDDFDEDEEEIKNMVNIKKITNTDKKAINHKVEKQKFQDIFKADYPKSPVSVLKQIRKNDDKEEDKDDKDLDEDLDEDDEEEIESDDGEFQDDDDDQ